jgi:hypothetical protein
MSFMTYTVKAVVFLIEIRRNHLENTRSFLLVE